MRICATPLVERPATFANVPHSWENSGEAYACSFARLCAGTLDEILNRLGPGHGARLLDVGTGPGTISAAASATGHVAIGLDSDASMIALVARRHPALAFARATIERLPSADQTFDANTANFVINHVPDPRGAATELRRVLRTGGRLVATIWPSRTQPLNQFWSEVMAHADVAPPTGQRLPSELDFDRTAEGLTGLLVKAEFDRIDVQDLEWTFEISPEHLWIAVEAGIAGIGGTYHAQDHAGRTRMRAAYDKITSERAESDTLSFPTTALMATAARPQRPGKRSAP